MPPKYKGGCRARPPERRMLDVKVFLIIIGIILISEVLEFILKVINAILQKKQLENEVSLLKCQLDTANSIIKHNNEVIDGMARNAKYCSPFQSTKKIVSQDEIDAVRYAMKHAHPDNGGNENDFIRFQKCYEELTRNGG